MTMLEEIETPTLIVDEARAQKNIEAFQQHCDAAGLKVRPHIKTHKTVHFAKQQIAAGAIGINCQKLGEAEVMADGGLDDILITFNIIGASKLQRLKALASRLRKLTVTADNEPVVDGLATAFKSEANSLPVMIECDTGAGRCGVQSSDEAVKLAVAVANKPGLAFAGLMTYPKPNGAQNAAAFMRTTVSRLSALNVECPEISTGGTPDMWQAATHNVFTEYRIGTYIYNDRSLIAYGTCKEENCAAYVLATVVSTPTPERAIIDAGSKALTSDLLGLRGHGHVVGYPEAEITALSEEHGTLKVQSDSNLKVGDRIRIIPNHVCVVSNMFDSVWLFQKSGALVQQIIDARGCVH